MSDRPADGNHTDHNDPGAELRATIAHLEHLLPGQGPILDFVHHNTIHGLQHKPFLAALAEYEAMTGIRGFQPEQNSRRYYQQGRISDADLDAVLDQDRLLQAGAELCAVQGYSLPRKALYRCALLHDLPDPSPAQLQWQLDNGGLAQLQQGIDTAAAARLLHDHADTGAALRALWQALCACFAVAEEFPHSEDYSEQPLPQDGRSPGLSAEAAARARSVVESHFGRIGADSSLRTLVLELCGVDVLDTVRPQLVRLGASLLDEGLASWHLADDEHKGLWQAWRRLLEVDAQPVLQELEGVESLLRDLSDDAWEALPQLLQLNGVPRACWSGYLERLALELPGWSGLITWRQQHPDYHCDNPAAPRLEDFLAVRLALDKLQLDRLCQELWKCHGDYESLVSRFRMNTAELQVRLALYAGLLPEYLTREAENLIIQLDVGKPSHQAWETLAVKVEQWRAATDASENAAPVASGSLWRLFCLCQHLGLAANDVNQLGRATLQTLLQTLEAFTPNERGRVWLLAYERHYRDEILTALAANRQRGGWLQRTHRPQAQIVMCMDEREESFRRNLEELNPAIETLGVAGFFGVPMRYQGLDAIHSTPLCPVVVTPVHKVDERIRIGEEEGLSKHRKGWQRVQYLTSLLHQKLRLEPGLALLVTLLAAPVVLLALLLESLFPAAYVALANRLRAGMVPTVKTELKLTASSTAERSPEGLQHGFTDQEQCGRVAGLLRALGLTTGFAPIVALSGHGSTSQNNPHEAAHDCGACGGRQGGPNARAFAAMANRAPVRDLLRADGIDIPDDCWFVGMQHDTCSDAITWYDTDDVPAALQERFEIFRATISQAQALSARERSRRFATAQKVNSAAAAFRHVTLRAQDPSQVRPEYGHATNACAVIGRRQLTQGVFLDRRAFLISYDPSSDPEGRILENILLTAGPVGAGINLEYYFSTIDNERFGCGTKIPHNVTGLFGVMEGASSDLRTGLPLQMVEIHEAMRLQVIVEASTAVVGRIYGDNPPLQELIGGGWLLVTAIDPDTGAISVFEPDKGFVPWQAESLDLPQRERSLDCYQGSSSPVSPMLIRQPDSVEAAA